MAALLSPTASTPPATLREHRLARGIESFLRRPALARRSRRLGAIIWSMITGAHVILFTPEADALRSVFRDTLGWKYVDAGDGWLIFALPPAEVAAHPTDGETGHELYFTCDDIDATIGELRGQGIQIRGEPDDRGWGIATTMVLPGGVEVTLYQPRHPLATQ